MFHKWAAELTPLTCALPTAAVCNTKPSVCRYGPINCSVATQNVGKRRLWVLCRLEKACNMNAGEKVARPDPHRGQILSFVSSLFAFFPVFLPTGTLSSWVKCPLLLLSREPERGRKKVKAIYT